MAITDTVKNSVTGSGGDTYLDRVRAGIALTSPSGKEFTGDFVSSDKSKDKKLQITSYFGIKGSKVKDLQIGSPTHNIPFSFSGSDNDLIAEEFWNACDEDGQWEIIHPVDGRLPLQLISVTMNASPVENGNQTDFETTWIHPLNEEAEFSGRQLASMAEFSVAEFNSDSALSFQEKLNALSESLKKNVANVVGQVAGFSEKVLGPVSALSDFAYQSFYTILDGINQIERLTIIEALALAGQIQNLIQIPLLSTSDIQYRNRKYIELSQEIGAISFDDNDNIKITNDQFGLNTAVIVELTQNAVLTSICKIAITGDFKTKGEAVKTIEDIVDTVDSVEAELDAIQATFSDNIIDQSFTHGSDRKKRDDLIGTVITYIITVAIQQKPEKIKVINNFIPPIMFCAKEYGTIDDEVLQSFIDKNDITGNELLMLSPGKEVIV